MKQVICINWGTKYGPLYINRLYGMVARNITPPFRFTCFCDNPENIRAEVDCQPLPEIDYEIPKAKTGIWPKSRLWGAALGDLQGPVLFLDLDVIVTGSLDSFFEEGAPEDVILTRNRVVVFEKLGQTSVFRFMAGGLKPLQDLFKSDPQGIAEEYRYEQRFVTRNAPGGVKFFPDGWVAHFRRDCRRPFPLNYVLPPKLPRGARIVIFAGHLNPQDAIDGRWSDAVPPRSPLAHLRAIGQRDRSGSLWRYLRHYIRPAPWVGEHWRP